MKAGHIGERLYCFGNDKERFGFTGNRAEYVCLVCSKCEFTAKDFLMDNEVRQRLTWKMAAARGFVSRKVQKTYH